MVVLATVLAGLVYPLVVTGLATAVYPDQANRSLLYRDGRPVGSSLIGQAFSDAEGAPLPQYFQPRPSAAGSGYDPTASGASNLGPSNPLLVGFVPGVNTVRLDGSTARRHRRTRSPRPGTRAACR
jgi:K+-transporting ATPase ATPase C chain